MELQIRMIEMIYYVEPEMEIFISHRANREKECILFFSVSSVRNIRIANHFNHSNLQLQTISPLPLRIRFSQHQSIWIRYGQSLLLFRSYKDQGKHQPLKIFPPV